MDWDRTRYCVQCHQLIPIGNEFRFYSSYEDPTPLYACNWECRQEYDTAAERRKLSLLGKPCMECTMGTDGIFRFCSDYCASTHRFSRCLPMTNAPPLQYTHALLPPPEKKKDKFILVPTIDEVTKHDRSAEGDPCCLCLENAPVCVILPCMHQCVCCECARLLGKNGNAGRGTVTCPKCRAAKIKAIKYVFV